MERLARHFEQLEEQDRGVEDYLRRYDRRGITASRSYDGMMVIQKVLPLEEGEEYLAHLEAGTGHIDRYTVHVVADLDALLVGHGRAELLDGSPLAIETLRRFACDSGIVRHLMKGGSEPLDVGTRTSVWTTAQRRAIQARDHGHCRWPGCPRRTCDCHGHRSLRRPGPYRGPQWLLALPAAPHCTHEGGFNVVGDGNGMLTFVRPDGTILGHTDPP